MIANPTEESMKLAKRINEYSAKYAVGGQMGIIINKVGQEDMSEVYNFARESEMEILGSIHFDQDLVKGSLSRDSIIVKDAIENLYFRLNLPQENK